MLPCNEESRVRYVIVSCLVMSVALFFVAPAPAQTAGGYTAPTEFMDLFFDFTGANEPGYPAGQPTLGQMLTQAATAKESAGAAPGPLVLVVGSEIYVYDSVGGARLGEQQFRADRSSGFYEMTAISHIGPALAYLAQIKADGDPRWKERLASLLEHAAQVRALNARAADNWLDRLDEPAWRTHKAEIRNMIDYACARTIDSSVLDASFQTLDTRLPQKPAWTQTARSSRTVIPVPPRTLASSS